uniref:PiggyBac transposable element-derived protein domain-containing protein n=1 Tax=Acrobeloides nanus TaxID=290746 RepID=A0A914EJN5_9BILA
MRAKKTKQVLLYSTLHHTDELAKNGKPQAIMDYNSIKWGVDMYDELLGHYGYSPGSRRWPMKIFNFMVFSAAMNAYAIQNHGESRRSFLNNLAEQLMAAQKLKKSESKNWISKIFLKISSLYDYLQKKMAGEEEKDKCYKCYQETSIFCEKCNYPCCNKHSKELQICNKCEELIDNGNKQNPSTSKPSPKQHITRAQVSQIAHTPKLGKCDKCGKRTNITFCFVCELVFCKDHKSKDNEICNFCLSK